MRRDYATCGQCKKSWFEGEANIKTRLRSSRSGLLFCGRECFRLYQMYRMRGKK
jgi:hypothetical protein